MRCQVSVRKIENWSKWFELKLDPLFHPNWSFLGTMCWPWSLLGHVHLSLCQKHKLRVANAVNNLCYGPDPTLGIVYLDSWQSHGWGWLLWGILWKVGLKEQRERKNNSKVTQELDEEKSKEKEKYTRNTSKKKRESLTQMKKEEKIAAWKNMRN